MELFHKYIEQVTTGSVLTCDLVKKAVNRHLSDLKRQGTADFPYFFSEYEATKVISFFSLLRHTKGKFGKMHFQLQPNQAFLLGCLFGWRKISDKSRRFTKAYVEVARKNGKSEMGAGIELYTLLCEGEEGAEVYSAATTRDQAQIVFEAAKKMAKMIMNDDPGFLGKHLACFAHSINFAYAGGFIKAVSADAGTLDGLNPHCGIIDEYHAHKTSDVLNIIKTGMGSRVQPLLFIITTAGLDKRSPCFVEERKIAIDVLSGTIDQENLFTIIYTLDEGDDWMDPAVWIKSNPNLGVTPNMDYMISAATEAQNYGGRYITQFLTKNLNVWVDAPKTWIGSDVWDKNGGKVSKEALKGRRCFGGLDLASVSDTASFELFFPAEKPGKKHIVLSYFFLPEAALIKDNRRQFEEWGRQGHVIITPGNTTDYDYIETVVRECADLFLLVSVQIDRYNSSQLRVNLAKNEAVPVQPFGQGFLSMSTPSKEWEKMLRNEEVNHGDHPVLAWMNKNVAIDTDPAENIKPNKDKSGDKIDGIVAVIMAIGGWLTWLADPKAHRPKGSYLLSEKTEE